MRQPVAKKAGDFSVKTSRPRLVAVEDDEDCQILYRQFLTDDYDLVLLPHGEELFEEIESLQPDIVMLDLQLPGPDGLRLCQRLRRHPRMGQVPILILTGRQDDAAMLGSFEMGATSFLLKPVTKRELLERLEELMEAK
ncbi:MAG: response regulator [Elusimicrobia bacterium]|nr:response regulator [Elusimicrobiota bacterium]